MSVIRRPLETDRSAVPVIEPSKGEVYRFVKESYAAGAAVPPKTYPSFNPTVQLNATGGGRFDCHNRSGKHWLYDRYSYLYAACTPDTAFWEKFGEERGDAHQHGLPFAVDPDNWIEVLEWERPLQIVDLDAKWPRRTVPARVTKTQRYLRCREWATWLRIRRPRAAGIRYTAGGSPAGESVVFFGRHPDRNTRGSCGRALKVKSSEWTFDLRSRDLMDMATGLGSGYRP